MSIGHSSWLDAGAKVVTARLRSRRVVNACCAGCGRSKFKSVPESGSLTKLFGHGRFFK